MRDHLVTGHMILGFNLGVKDIYLFDSFGPEGLL